jgi:hypothetical protein
MKMQDQEELATILQSASTNTRAYKVIIRNDGSATAEVAASRSPTEAQPARSKVFPAGTIDAKQLQRLLSQIEDVSKIPVGPCVKSASFGTRTQIAYAGKTSGDLQCVRGDTPTSGLTKLPLYESLSLFVATTLRDLKVNSSGITSSP